MIMKIESRLAELENMFYNQLMDDLSRLKLLTDQMELEPAEEHTNSRPSCYTPSNPYGAPAMTPKPGEPLLTKRRVGPFSTTNLDELLKERNYSAMRIVIPAKAGIH